MIYRKFGMKSLKNMQIILKNSKKWLYSIMIENHPFSSENYKNDFQNKAD